MQGLFGSLTDRSMQPPLFMKNATQIGIWVAFFINNGGEKPKN